MEESNAKEKIKVQGWERMLLASMAAQPSSLQNKE